MESTLTSPSELNMALAAMDSVNTNTRVSLKALDSAFLVPLELISPVEQPRNIGIFDHEKDRELINQIAEERALKGGIAGTGILQAILLRPDSATTRFFIVAGERRYRAATFLGLPALPALIEEMSAASAWRAAIVENIQRKDLTPNEEALAFFKWMQNEGVTKEDIAKEIGRSISFVSARLDILNQPADLRAMIAANPQTSRAVRELAAVPESDRREIVQQLAGGASYNSLKPAIQNVRQKHQARTRQNQYERESEEPKPKVVAPSRLPRIAYVQLIANMNQTIEETIDVCANVSPQGDKKREMQRAIDHMRARLNHLESII